MVLVAALLCTLLAVSPAEAEQPVPAIVGVDVDGIEDEMPTDGWLTRTDGVEGLAASQANPLVDAKVWDIAYIGDRMFVSGSFTTVVRSTDAWQREPQAFVAAMDYRTGKFIDTWRPSLNGPAWALDVLPDGNLLVGGEFTEVNGAAREALVALDPLTGETAASFTGSVARPWSDKLALVRDTFVQGNDLYVIGNFARAFGAGNRVDVTKVVRMNATSGRPDAGWKPVLAGKSGWSVVATADGQVVHLGGEFASVNGDPATNTYAVVDGNTGALVPGANHGLPVPPHRAWPVGGVIYDLEIQGNLVYLAGAEHFYQLRNARTGANVNLVLTWPEKAPNLFNDTQVINVFGGTLFVGCHCARHFGFQNMEANPGNGVQFNSLTDYNTGGDGVWAQGLAPDGCMWFGGEIYGSTRIVGRADGVNGWVGHLARYCGADGPEPLPPSEIPLVPSGDSWKVSTAATWPNGWADPGFNDGGWPIASTEMGYGDGDEATVISNANRTVGVLARKNFTVSNPDIFTHLRLRLVADDGVTVWINGQPRLAHRMPEGALEPTTLANTTAWGAAERDFTEFAIDADDLVAGQNTIAVSIHQAWANSADLSMDLELIGSTEPAPALTDRPDLGQDGPAPIEVVLRERSEGFRYSSTLTSGWTDPSFDDAGWATGTGVAGFAEPVIDTDIGAGEVAYAWRTSFAVTDTALDSVTALIERDDGVAVWVNGTQVALDNVAAPITDDTLASSFVWGRAESTPVEISIDPALLVNGENTIAVSLHQAHPDSLDLRLAVDITATKSQ